MKIPRQDDLRANQKARTRAALVDAAVRLLRTGAPPTVAEAADEAKVSRATAYRYFPTQESLLLEIADTTPTITPVEEMLASLATEDPEERLARLLDTCNGVVFAEEASMRTALRLYLDTWLESRRKGQDAPALREGRRVRWLDETLKPARKQLTDKQWRRLRAALSLTLSIEAMVVMKDVCQLDDDEAKEVLRWAASVLLKAGLNEPGTTARRAPKPAGIR